MKDRTERLWRKGWVCGSDHHLLFYLPTSTSELEGMNRRTSWGSTEMGTPLFILFQPVPFTIFEAIRMMLPLCIPSEERWVVTKLTCVVSTWLTNSKRTGLVERFVFVPCLRYGSLRRRIRGRRCPTRDTAPPPTQAQVEICWPLWQGRVQKKSRENEFSEK